MSKIRVSQRGQNLHEVFIDLNTDFRTNKRGSDFRIFANTGYEPNDADCGLLIALAAVLINFDTGVTEIVVSPYRIVLKVIQLTADNVWETVLQLCHNYVDDVEVAD